MAGSHVKIVHPYEYSIPDTFDMWQLQKAVTKAMAEAIATLTRSIFDEDDETGEIDLGDWILRADKSFGRRGDFEPHPGENLIERAPNEVLHAFIHAT